MAAAADPCRALSSDLSVISRLLHRSQQGRSRDRPSVLPVRAPQRCDVSLLDPCCGHLSPGSDLKLRPFIALPHVTSDLWVPPGLRQRGRTALPRTVSLSLDTAPEKSWNSRREHHAALRARVYADPDADPPRHVAQALSSGVSLRAEPQPQICEEEVDRRGRERLLTVKWGLKEDKEPSSAEWVSAAIRHFTYTSATQRSYEEVNWDGKLPRRLKAPESTLEMAADAVRVPSTRRYHERPQRWQSEGAEWDQRQLRSQEDVRKPISFCSGCPRSGQIPNYTGVVGSTRPQDIDDADRGFSPLTMRRSQQPPYTPTAR
uniref:Uncharacterized protein n=1 Tax=Knipowitschia caucasica TaxID=637954 RepID=A0AAV2JGI4_KNICA